MQYTVVLVATLAPDTTHTSDDRNHCSLIAASHPGLIATVKAVNKLKPWQTNKAVSRIFFPNCWFHLQLDNKDLNAELRKLGLKKKDLKLSGDAPLFLDTENSDVDRVRLRLAILILESLLHLADDV